MENTMMNSQSAAAKNSAKTSFMLSASTMFPFFGYNKKEITDELNKIDIINFIAQSIRECKTKAQFILEFGDERYCIFLNKDDKGYYITVDETSSKTVQRPVKEIKRHYFFCDRLTRNNIDGIANYVYGIVADYYYGYGIYDAETVNNDVEVSEAPALEEAPALDEAPILDEDYTIEEVCDGFYEIVFNDGDDNNITEEGYSVAGLKYLAETMPVVPVDAIVEGVNEYFSDCYAVARKRCMGFYECDFEEFCDIVWSYVWPNVMTDEALEAETRYYMEFDDRLRYMLDNGELGALYIYNNGFVRSRFDEEAEVAA